MNEGPNPILIFIGMPIPYSSPYTVEHRDPQAISVVGKLARLTKFLARFGLRLFSQLSDFVVQQCKLFKVRS